MSEDKIEHFRLTIVKILEDIRGDNPSPSDEVLQANASLLYSRYTQVLAITLEREEREIKKGLVKEIFDAVEELPVYEAANGIRSYEFDELWDKLRPFET